MGKRRLERLREDGEERGGRGERGGEGAGVACIIDS